MPTSEHSGKHSVIPRASFELTHPRRESGPSPTAAAPHFHDLRFQLAVSSSRIPGRRSEDEDAISSGWEPRSRKTIRGRPSKNARAGRFLVHVLNGPLRTPRTNASELERPRGFRVFGRERSADLFRHTSSRVPTRGRKPKPPRKTWPA